MIDIFMVFSIIVFLGFQVRPSAKAQLANLPEPQEDDIIFLDDEDDTQPFIRLPFYNRDEDEVTGNFERASISP